EPAAQPAVLHPLFRCCVAAGAGHAVLHIPGMLDIYTAVPIRGQSAVHPATRALVNDGRTANVGRAPRLAFGLRVRARKLRGHGISGWPGAPLRRLAAPSPPPWDRGRRLCRFSISMVLAVSETSSSVALRCGAPRPANISRCSRA